MSLKPGMTISKARRILGKHGEQFSDDQVGELLHTLQLLAREQLLYNGSKVSKYSNESEHSNSTK